LPIDDKCATVLDYSLDRQDLAQVLVTSNHQEKETKMAAKKGKRKIKAQDLKPKKDAKGGIIGVLGPQVNRPGHNLPTTDMRKAGGDH
jgi:hypothetical protein